MMVGVLSGWIIVHIFEQKEMMVCIGKGLLAGMLAAWILYQSVYGMVTAFIFIHCVFKERKGNGVNSKETLLAVPRCAKSVAATQAGYSMENAWRESGRR